MSQFSERLCEIVTLKARSKYDFAMQIGVSPKSVSNYLNGTAVPGYDILCKILDLFPEISAEWLMRGKGEMISSDKRVVDVSKIESIIKANADFLAKTITSAL